MPDPIPKHPSARQRRNKTVGPRTLHPVPAPTVPELPSDRGWLPATVTWWVSVWRSPMASEYDESDVHGMLILASLVDMYWSDPSKELAGEIRLQRQSFGLTPYDRRRLQWEIDRGEQAVEQTSKRRAKPKKAPDEGDLSALTA